LRELTTKDRQRFSDLLALKQADGKRFSVEFAPSRAAGELGHLIFDRIFPLVIKLCMDETGHLFIAFAFLGADEERVKTLAPFTES
jgi:hypothetical protein